MTVGQAVGVATVPWTAPQMALAQGFDTLSCNVLGGALDMHGAEPEPTTPGQRTTFNLQLVESSQELREMLDVSAQGSMEMGAYGGDAKAKFAANRSVNSSSVFFVASVVVADRTEQYDEEVKRHFELDESLREMYAKRPHDFRRRYGDCFISGSELGGELYCVLELMTHSTDDKKALSAEVKGHGGSFSAEASFSGAVDRLSRTSKVNVHVYKSGGRSLNLKSDQITVSQFVDMAGSFPDEVRNAPQPLRAVLTPYEQLPRLEGPGSPFDVDRVEQRIVELGHAYLRYQDALSDLAYMLDNEDQFVHPRVIPSEVDKVRRAIEIEQEKVSARIEELVDDPGTRHPDIGLKSVDDLTRGLPQRLHFLPRSALDLKKQYGDLHEDGDYDIYLDGEMENRVTLFCAGMATATPREYLTLVQTGGERNRSFWPMSPTPGQRWRRGHDLSTSYYKVRFDPVSRTVDTHDTTYATTSGGPLTDTDVSGGSRSIPFAPYGVAGASNHVEDADSQPRTPYGRANVDMGGTPFRIDPDVRWKASGFDLKPSAAAQGPAAGDGHAITVEIGGAPGTIAPDPELRLVLVRHGSGG